MYFLQRLFQKKKTEQQLESELAFDLEQRTEDLRRRGMSLEEARRAAQIELGGIETVKEQCRESSRAYLIETCLQDLRYGLRLMRRSPAFSAAAILTLALGIGATTAVFSVVDAVLLRPLPYPDADRIIFPWRAVPPALNVGYDQFPWGRLDFQIMAADVHAFQDTSAFVSDSFTLTGRGDPIYLDGLRTSAGLFNVLGIKPALGRAFTAEEDQPGHDREVILGYKLWRDRFARSSNVLGQTVTLNGAAYTVIGVMPQGFVFPRGDEMPPGFNFPEKTELWVPIALRVGPRERDETSDGLAVLGRLRPGFTRGQLQAELALFTKKRESVYPKSGAGWFDSRVVSMPQQITGDVRHPLWLIFAAVGLVLLLACSNIAGLLLARSVARRRELSLRSALGAAQHRILRQLLTESLVLSACGGVLGIAAAKLFVELVKRFGPSGVPRLQETSLDPWVLVFACAATLVTGLLFGLAPGLSARRISLMNSLRETGTRSGGSARAPRARSAILVAQMAFAVVLVVAAGLLAQTFAHLLKVNPGFNSDRVLTFYLSLPGTQYPGEQAVVAFYQRLLPQLRSVAGVQSAAVVAVPPMAGTTESSGIRVPDRVSTSPDDKPFANYSVVSSEYFNTVQSPLLRGREFLESDTAESTPVVIVNRAMAEKYWPGQNPLGKQVGLAATRFPLMTIVGVCADMKHISLREQPSPEMYVPYTQKPYPSMQVMGLVVRTRGDVDSAMGGIRKAIRFVDPDLALANMSTLSAIVAGSLAKPRFSVLLLGAFAAIAVLLSAIGIYGLVSYSVSQRTREMGIRMALGARRQSIFAMVLGQGVRLAALGIVIGLLVTLATVRVMAGFLYGVQPLDPLTFACVALLLVTVTVIACYLPARRATTVEPTLALRSE